MTVVMLAASVAHAGNADVHDAVEFIARDIYLDEMSDDGALGELAASLIEREIDSRRHEYPPRPVSGPEVGVLVGALATYCNLYTHDPSSEVLWSRYGSREKVLARANLTAEAGPARVLAATEWESIVRENSDEPWLRIVLCLAASDIFRSQKASVADVRAAAAILEEAVSTGRSLPDTSGRYSRVDSLELPEIQRCSPWLDGWGRPILFESDGRTFVVLSPGTDGAIGPSCVDDPSDPARNDPDCDIVYVAGGGGRVPPGISGW